MYLWEKGDTKRKQKPWKQRLSGWMKVCTSRAYFGFFIVVGRTWAKTCFWKNFKFIFQHQLLRHWSKQNINKRCIYMCVCLCVCVFCSQKHKNKSNFAFFYKRHFLLDLIFVVGNKHLRTCRDFSQQYKIMIIIFSRMMTSFW